MSTDSQSLLEQTRPHRFWTRKEKKLWIVLIFIAGAMLYASRTAMPVCAVSVAKEFNWTKKQIGMVLSSFFWGYITTQIIGGVMADKYGGEYTIAFSLAGWSSLTFLTPFVVYWVDPSSVLYYCTLMRFFTGCFQGLFFPSISSLFSKKVPEAERAFSYSFAVSGSHIGTMFSGIVGSLLNEYLGWKFTFITIGALSFVLFVVYHLLIIGTFFYNSKKYHPIKNPHLHKTPDPYHQSHASRNGATVKHQYKDFENNDFNGANEDHNEKIQIVVGDSDDGNYERNHMAQKDSNIYTSNHHDSKTNCTSKKGNFAWCILFTKTPFWALLIGSFCSGWEYFNVLSWLSTYFRETFPDSNSTVFNTVPWLFGPPTQWLSGWMADNMTRKGFSTTFVRKFIQSIAFLGTALFLVLMSHSTSYLYSLLFITLAINFSCFHQSGISVLPQDIAPSFAGVAFGIQNMAGSAPGFIGVYITGCILEASKSWTIVFDLNAAILVFGWVVFTIFGTGKKII